MASRRSRVWRTAQACPWNRTKKWSDVRAKHVTAAGPDLVAEHAERMLARVRAHSLAEMRRRKGLTQRQVAEGMGVSTSRVSQIEHGDLSGLDVLDRYIQALGGQLDLVATYESRCAATDWSSCWRLGDASDSPPSTVLALSRCDGGDAVLRLPG